MLLAPFGASNVIQVANAAAHFFDRALILSVVVE
jgi:hypothetical protein